MKKIFTLLSVLTLAATSAFAQVKTYTGNLFVTVGEEAPVGPMESTIIVTKQDDGNYTFALKNFVLKDDETELPVGNVEMTDIPVSEEGGVISLKHSAGVMITDGDAEGYDFWMGPFICAEVGAIPVDIDAYMTDDKLYAKINIDLTSTALEMAIKVTFDEPFPVDEGKTYTGNLFVTVGETEPAGPIESTVIVNKLVDGTYSLSLKNFVLTDGETDIPVGNVKVTGIPAEKKGDAMLLKHSANVMLTEGDAEGYDFWLGPMICEEVGAIPVDIDAKMTDDKLYANINIDLTSTALEMAIKVTFGEDFPIVDGISNVTTTTTDDMPVFNVAGQRVNANTKGLVIKGGKVYLNK